MHFPARNQTGGCEGFELIEFTADQAGFVV